MLAQTEDKGREERIIRSGYVLSPLIKEIKPKCCSPTKVGLGEYLGSLKRIDRALAQMTATKLRVNQQAIGDYSELLAEGSDQLQNMFRTSLSENLQTIEPLHYITKRQPLMPDFSTFAKISQNFLFQ